MTIISAADQVSLLLSLLSADSKQALCAHSEVLLRCGPPSETLIAECQQNLIGFVGALIEAGLVPKELQPHIASAYSWASGTAWLQDFQFESQQNDPAIPRIVEQPTSAIVGVAAGDVVLSKDEYIYRSFIDLINTVALESPEAMASLVAAQLQQ